MTATADNIRDQVMDALLARLETRCAKTFRTYSRRFLTWQDMVQKLATGTGPNVPQQPALYLFDGVGFGQSGTDLVERKSLASPAIITMRRCAVVYARFPGGGKPGGADDTTPGGSVFYSLIKSIEDGFAPDDPAYNTLTLGGLVSHCWIEGEIHYITGEVDPMGQGMMVVPFNIKLLPTTVIAM